MPLNDEAEQILQERTAKHESALVRCRERSRHLEAEEKINGIWEELQKVGFEKQIISCGRFSGEVNFDGDSETVRYDTRLTADYHPFSNLTVTVLGSGLEEKGGQFRLGVAGSSYPELWELIGDLRRLEITITVATTDDEGEPVCQLSVSASSLSDVFSFTSMITGEYDLKMTLKEIWETGQKRMRGKTLKNFLIDTTKLNWRPPVSK